MAEASEQRDEGQKILQNLANLQRVLMKLSDDQKEAIILVGADVTP